jgi:phage head maturation protease
MTLIERRSLSTGAQEVRVASTSSGYRLSGYAAVFNSRSELLSRRGEGNFYEIIERGPLPTC